MPILSIDPGDKRIGLAISDQMDLFARPLTTIKHVSRMVDAATIVQIATENSATLILVGQALDDEGQPTPEGRKSARLAEAIQKQTSLPVKLWDESGSTGQARAASIAMGDSAYKRQKRGHGHLDDMAAAVILQDYLDSSQA